MPNLFERLKPEAKAVIEGQADKYPLSVSSILEQMKSNHFVEELQYSSVMWLARDSKLREIAGMHPYDYMDHMLSINLSEGLFND
jgi:hypothetical protein